MAPHTWLPSLPCKKAKQQGNHRILFLRRTEQAKTRPHMGATYPYCELHRCLAPHTCWATQIVIQIEFLCVHVCVCVNLGQAEPVCRTQETSCQLKFDASRISSLIQYIFQGACWCVGCLPRGLLMHCESSALYLLFSKAEDCWWQLWKLGMNLQKAWREIFACTLNWQKNLVPTVLSTSILNCLCLQHCPFLIVAVCMCSCAHMCMCIGTSVFECALRPTSSFLAEKMLWFCSGFESPSVISELSI